MTTASARDRALLSTAAFVRAVTTAFLGVTLGLYLARAGLDPAAIGLVVSAGFAGGATAATLATVAGERFGRRRFLIATSLAGILGTAVLAVTSHPLALALAAFVGMVNGMGKDRGAALILEQAALPGTTTAADRTRTIAVYTMLQDLGHAAGALLAAVPGLAAASLDVTPFAAQRTAILACAASGLLLVALYARLGPAVESAAETGRSSLRPESRRVLVRISSLFALDSLAGGFLTTTLLSYFFFERFAVGEATIAALFFAARLLNALSHLGAAWLARRIGLVNTMVFTHIPSSLLLATVAIAPSFPVAAVLFLLREGLVEMDVPTRQSYVLAVVAPEERTVASGVTNLVRLAGWAVAPVVAGQLMTTASLAVPLVVGAALKIAYDLLLWLAFHRLPPPEEIPPA